MGGSATRPGGMEFVCQCALAASLSTLRQDRLSSTRRWRIRYQPVRMNWLFQQTAGRYQEVAASFLDRALGQGDPTEKAALLDTARSWLALTALAQKLANEREKRG